jgi:hemoglobin
MQEAMQSSSVHAALGGAPAVEAIVDGFYERVLCDDGLKGYFARTDLISLKDHLRRFFTAAAGGPDTYLGRSMVDAHSTVGITPEHFSRAIMHLVDTLADYAVPTGLISQIASQFSSFEGEIAVPPRRAVGSDNL